MIRRIGALAAAATLLFACADVGVGFDYRVPSKDPKIAPAQILTSVNRALEPPEGDGTRTSAGASSWPKVNEQTGEITFGLAAIGRGRTPSIRNAETRLLKDLRYEF